MSRPSPEWVVGGRRGRTFVCSRSSNPVAFSRPGQHTHPSRANTLYTCVHRRYVRTRGVCTVIPRTIFISSPLWRAYPGIIYNGFGAADLPRFGRRRDQRRTFPSPPHRPRVTAVTAGGIHTGGFCRRRRRPPPRMMILSLGYYCVLLRVGGRSFPGPT